MGRSSGVYRVTEEMWGEIPTAFTRVNLAYEKLAIHLTNIAPQPHTRDTPPSLVYVWQCHPQSGRIRKSLTSCYAYSTASLVVSAKVPAERQVWVRGLSPLHYYHSLCYFIFVIPSLSYASMLPIFFFQNSYLALCFQARGSFIRSPPLLSILPEYGLRGPG